MTRLDMARKIVLIERERDALAAQLRDSSMLEDLTLSVFLLAFRKQLVAYRQHPAMDVATPGEVLDAVVRSIDLAIKETKGGES